MAVRAEYRRKQIAAKLRYEVRQIETHQRALDAAIRRRDDLLLAGRRAGFSLRGLAPLAGLSNVAVLNGSRRAEEREVGKW